MHCALRRAMHAGRRALSTTPAPQSQSRSWVLGVASAAAGAAGALAVAGERPPPSVAEWAARDDPGSSNAEQRFAQWKRVDEGLVTSGAAKSNAIYDAFGGKEVIGKIGTDIQDKKCGSVWKSTFVNLHAIEPVRSVGCPTFDFHTGAAGCS